MLDIEIIQEILIVSIILSTISCTFIQKTKVLLKSNKYIIIYSLLVNIILGIVFCYSFTTITFPKSIWIGLFSFVGADTIYKSLEGKIQRYRDIRKIK